MSTSRVVGVREARPDPSRRGDRVGRGSPPGALRRHPDGGVEGPLMGFDTAAKAEEPSVQRTITLVGARGGQGTPAVATALALIAGHDHRTTLVTTDPMATAAVIGMP